MICNCGHMTKWYSVCKSCHCFRVASELKAMTVLWESQRETKHHSLRIRKTSEQPTMGKFHSSLYWDIAKGLKQYQITLFCNKLPRFPFLAQFKWSIKTVEVMNYISSTPWTDNSAKMSHISHWPLLQGWRRVWLQRRLPLPSQHWQGGWPAHDPRLWAPGLWWRDRGAWPTGQQAPAGHGVWYRLQPDCLQLLLSPRTRDGLLLCQDCGHLPNSYWDR